MLVHSKAWPIFDSQNALWHGVNVPVDFFYMKGRYNACVMHHIWMPYSNGFMLKTYFKYTFLFLDYLLILLLFSITSNKKI